MQFSLALLCVLAAAKTMDAFVIPNFGKGELYKDFQEFIDLLPEDDILGLVMQYVAEDEEFQQALGYMQGDTFQKLVVEVESIPEVVKLLHYLNDAGVDIYAMVNQLNGFLGVPSLVPPPAPVFITAENGKGIAGLIAKIQALLPVKKLEALYNKKMQESKAFQDFIAQMKSPNFQTIVNKVYANPHFQELLAYAKQVGVDVEMIKQLLYNILGITVPKKSDMYLTRKPSSQLAQDLADFIALIPAKQAEDIVTSYMAEDQQVQKALAYLHTKEFQKMILDVEGLKEYQALVKYLDQAGLDVITYIRTLHAVLGMEDYVPPSLLESRKVGDGLKGMYNDLKKIIPVQKVKNMYYDKLHNSKAFREFVDHIKSRSFQNIIDSLYSHKVFVEMITKAKAAGLDLEAFADFLHNVFGLNFPNHRM